MSAADIARLDVPLDRLAANLRALTLRDGALAEQRHQYLDLDADSACRPDGFCCPACPPREGATA
ncbi:MULTISPECIES: hypothetical protein [Streptomyces]|uniref:Uncharacterized protein n=1 Tax=Streptomyces fradiae ATCC 10745 = DSM 40063 TaxID=1319510 RepID=A0A1Y2NSC3_STRFR|nr:MULTISPECIES: hypothetical protein [Streptomyces]KAF0651334.1 hypothetical protein K701_04175 [Streptomyces fradiae ATCC 10745 = DSM 40063]OSY50403.1 hypothetical protein BG846_03979 [Streptomyces fradiae ATCC 10745 = DSM 40063]QEV11672.1 hypothetical protein CP974_06190 [Streptomyces fradiae ATCC 10745 = DSM 40063]